LAKSIASYNNGGALPQSLKVNRPLGPLEMPISQPEASRVALKEIYELAAHAIDHLDFPAKKENEMTVAKLLRHQKF
jgi:hypothetical protein